MSRYRKSYTLVMANKIGCHPTKIQKEVINDINNGAMVITDSSFSGAIISRKGGDEYYISSRTFWNMVDKGIIAQQLSSPFEYILTNEFRNGKDI